MTKVFNHEQFGGIQVVTLAGKVMFGATQVARTLGYSNPQKAIRDHCKSDGCTNRSVIDPLGRSQMVKFITEGNVYRLIARSKLPSAEKFECWIFEEVLPSIRKNGMYATDSLLDDPDLLLKTVTKLTEERRARLEAEKKAAFLQAETEAQAEIIEEQAGRLTYLDKILQSTDTMNVTQIAADYGLTARQLNEILKEERIQRRTGGQWVLCAKYHGKGYTKSYTHAFPIPTGGTKTVVNTRWTQSGRLLIHEVLVARGIEANVDRSLAA
ncbi:DNA-binding protein [Paenibacillus sp. CAA11]|nr:DNA-binding protein [Paenibacillus sp. CAA11]